MKRNSIFAASVALLCLAWPIAGASETANGPFLAEACASCHGASWGGQGPIADLRGYDHEAFVRTWEEFRSDERPATIMNRIARGYSEAEVSALADFFSSLE